MFHVLFPAACSVSAALPTKQHDEHKGASQETGL